MMHWYSPTQPVARCGSQSPRWPQCPCLPGVHGLGWPPPALYQGRLIWPVAYSKCRGVWLQRIMEDIALPTWLSLRWPALGEASHHVVKTLKKPVERPRWKGTEASCLTWVSPCGDKPPALVMPFSDHSPSYNLIVNSWENLNPKQNYAAKPFLMSSKEIQAC